LRNLANGIVRQIEDPNVIIKRLGFTSEEYVALTETRAFRLMLLQAQAEWEGAGNTHKRIKLKAAVNIEEALPHFYHAMIDPKEPLSAKVKAFEVVSKVAGLGIPEPVAAGNGQFFKLEINLGAGMPALSYGITPIVEAVVEESSYSIATAEEVNQIIREAQERGAAEPYSQSKLLEGIELEEL
jgi:hypothetical protein